MMRKSLLVGLLLIAACGTFAFRSQAGGAVMTGDYVEARTASVFAGACHYNGEVVTTGRDAVMAWNIKSGAWKGTTLDGVRAVAIVRAVANLSDTEAAREAEIIVDSAATDAQVAALTEVLQAKRGATLGKVLAVHRAPVTFKREGSAYAVKAVGFAGLSVQAMPNDDCCKMPNLVWYSPLMPLSNRKVGYTTEAVYEGGKVGEMWQRAGENSAFYGSFSL